MLSWIRRLLKSSARNGAKGTHKHPRLRPFLETLEDRTLLSTFTVGAGGFGSLQQALDTASAGDTILLLANTNPGAFGPIAKSGITIQGDPSTDLSSLPNLGTITIAGGVQGVTLRHLELNSLILSSGSNQTTVDGVLDFGGIIEVGGGRGNGGNLIINSNIQGDINLTGNLPGVVTGDVVRNNHLAGNTLFVTQDDGFVLQGNDSNHGLSVSLTETKNALINRNSLADVRLIAAHGIGGDTTAIVSNNAVFQIAITGNGVRNLGTVIARIEGNDLRGGNPLNPELLISGDAAVDAGGGLAGFLPDSLGDSRGGNIFRDSAGGTAIVTSSTWFFGRGGFLFTVSAQNNIWQGGTTDIQKIAGQNTNIPPSQGIDISNPLDANHAFVQALYRDFLGRSASVGEQGVWVRALTTPGSSRAVIANAISHSAEALGTVVNDLYLKYLGRDADSAGKAGWTAFLQNGGTEEQLAGNILGSGEFYARSGNTDQGYVRALYSHLLNRSATVSDVNFWTGMLPTLGRAGAATAIAQSLEFRTSTITGLYRRFLHRHGVGAAEVAGWANSKLSVLAIQTSFASSDEFFHNG